MTLSPDIANLERLYATGETTPEEVVREVYARIAARGDQPDWITLVDEDAALERARNAPPGPLYGMPFAVKDNIDVAGLPTTCACPAFAYTAEHSATVVDLLEQAGAILIGKTNLDQLATGLNGTRSPYGIPASTFDPAYISGGSSSGSAVAVAAGLVSFALGTDTAGSGRVPAAFNNLVGLKPTKGLISTHGVVPACRTQDVVSILALTVADAAKVAAVACRYDEADSYARVAAPPFAVDAAPRDLRVGVPGGPIPFFGDTAYESLYRAAIERMAGLGAEIVTIDYAPFEQAAAMLYAGPWVAERLAAVEDLAGRDPGAIHPVVRGLLLGARGRDLQRLLRACRVDPGLRTRMGEDGSHAAAHGRHHLHHRRHTGRAGDAQYGPRRLYELCEPDGSCRLGRARGLPPRWHPFRRDADRSGFVRRHARLSWRRAA